MSERNVYVTIVADTSRFDAAMRKAARAMSDFARATNLAGVFWRARLTPGERHIDRICKEILAGKPGRPAEIRLLAAADFAAVLDRSQP